MYRRPGKVVDEPEDRAGFIGCGSHSFRNILPTFQFAPVRLVATCDVDVDKAQAFSAAKFGAQAVDGDHRAATLEREELDALFIVTSPDEHGRPRYPRALALDCLEANRHVWMEMARRHVRRDREAHRGGGPPGPATSWSA